MGHRPSPRNVWWCVVIHHVLSVENQPAESEFQDRGDFGFHATLGKPLAHSTGSVSLPIFVKCTALSSRGQEVGSRRGSFS